MRILSSATNLDVIQEVEYVKQEARIVYLLECLQKTAPPAIIFCENKADVDDIRQSFPPFPLFPFPSPAGLPPFLPLPGAHLYSILALTSAYAHSRTLFAISPIPTVRARAHTRSPSRLLARSLGRSVARARALSRWA